MEEIEEPRWMENHIEQSFMIRKLVNMKYKKGSLINKHMSRFQNAVNQLATMKMILDDELQALLLLSFLSNSWKTLFVSLYNSALNSMVTLGMVKDSIFNEEIRRRK